MVDRAFCIEQAAVRFWTSGRVFRIAVAIAIALLIALCVVGVTDSKTQTSSLYRGDFPPFYTAGLLIRTNPEELYNQNLHFELQNQFWPSFQNTAHVFVYPPFVAVFFAPISMLSPVAAKFVYFLFSVFSIFGTTWFLAQLNGAVKNNLFATFIFVLSAGPMFSGVMGGQNNSLSMLLYAAALYFFSKNTTESDLSAGCMLGLLCFKPHLALAPLVFIALAGKWRAIFGAILPVSILTLIGGLAYKIDWPINWLQVAIEHAERDSTTNQFQMISPFGLRDAINSQVSNIGFLTTGLAFCVCIFVFCFTAMKFYQTRKMSRETFGSALLLLGPASLILSPHTLYYEFGLLVVALLCKERFLVESRGWLFASGWLALGLLTLFKGCFFFQPMGVILLAGYVYVSTQLNRPSPISSI